MMLQNLLDCLQQSSPFNCTVQQQLDRETPDMDLICRSCLDCIKRTPDSSVLMEQLVDANIQVRFGCCPSVAKGPCASGDCTPCSVGSSRGPYGSNETQARRCHNIQARGLPTSRTIIYRFATFCLAITCLRGVSVTFVTFDPCTSRTRPLYLLLCRSSGIPRQDICFWSDSSN